jgi:hexokinase
MPGTKGRVGIDEFFDHLAALAAPLIEKNPNVGGIGFTFSYPMDVTKDMDGILRGFSKEVDAPDVIGKAIGQGLRDALARKKVKVPERIVLLNDTAATLLAGLVGKPGDVSAVVGFILGTGFNTAYPEKTIPKIGFDSQKPQIVVCETGGFMHRYMGVLDRAFDVSTKNPGVFHMEKLTAGAYLGPLTFSIVRQAIADGLISFAESGAFLAAIPKLQTKDLNMYLSEGIGPLKEFFDKDADARAAVAYLTSIVTERGARLASGVLAATVEKTGGGQNPLLPVNIAVEGTTYMLYKGMRAALESYLHLLLADKGIAYEITPVDQASLFGAAVAALS